MTKVDSSFICCCSRRTLNNITRVGVAGGLSWAGAMIAGFIPNTVGIGIGALVSGIANGLSTAFSWNDGKKTSLENRVTLLEKEIEVLKETIKTNGIFLEKNPLLNIKIG